MTGPNLLSFGSLEPSAQRLLQRARGLARSGQPVDTLHLLLAALPDDLNQPETRAIAVLIAHLPQPETLRSLLHVEISINTHGDDGAFSTALLRCAARWSQRAADEDIRVTDALMLWAVITDNNPASETLRAIEVDRSRLLMALEQLFHEEAHIEALERTKLADRPAPPSLPEDKVIAYHRAISLTWLLHPTKRPHLRDRHAVLMGNVLDRLGTCEPTELPVVVGHNGSPIQSVPQVLADRLAGSEVFAEQRARLSRYRRVHFMDMQTVVQLAKRDDEPDPQDVLEMAMIQSIQDQAILVLDRMEDLGELNGDTTERQIVQSVIAQLTEPSGALILGLYELPDGAGESIEKALDLSNIIQIAAREYSPRETKTLLYETYIPDWKPRGFHFEPEAFDTVLALAPGAWIDVRRKRLPYMAVDVAGWTMAMLRDGRALIAQTARLALEALEDLHQEWATTDERTRMTFEKPLEEARQDLEWLAKNPDPVVEHGQTVVKRAHVTAQLICPNASEFHYPGHAPKQLIKSRLDDIPPGED